MKLEVQAKKPLQLKELMNNMKKIILAFVVFLVFFSQISIGDVSRKEFNKLNKKEQLSVLKSMRKQELSQVNSQIKDTKYKISTVEHNTVMPLNKKQAELLDLNRQLTALTDRKSEMEKMYKAKINSVKNK